MSADAADAPREAETAMEILKTLISGYFKGLVFGLAVFLLLVVLHRLGLW